MTNKPGSRPALDVKKAHKKIRLFCIYSITRYAKLVIMPLYRGRSLLWTGNDCEKLKSCHITITITIILLINTTNVCKNKSSKHKSSQ